MTKQEQAVLNQLTAKCQERKLAYTDAFSYELRNGVVSTIRSLDNTISGTIQELWKSTKSEKGQTESITTKVNDLLKQKLYDLWSNLKARALSFWKMKQTEFKKALISIIVESPNLTKEQQELLKNAIMQIDGSPNYTLGFSIQSDEIVGGFLFIKKLKTEEVKQKFMAGFSKGCMSITGDLNYQSTQALDQMINKVRSQFQYLVTTYNPKVITLRHQFEECDRKRDNMMRQQKQIQWYLSEVESLTAFIKTSDANRR